MRTQVISVRTFSAAPVGSCTKKQVSLRSVSLPKSPGKPRLQPTVVGGGPGRPEKKKRSATEGKSARGARPATLDIIL